MTQRDLLEVPPEQLRRYHDPAEFQFECTEELAPLTEFIGQDRAVRALQFGLGLDKAGYNIFVTGLTGTGKATAIMDYIKKTVEERRQAGEIKGPDDWCYVYNFEDPDKPNAIRLPEGMGRKLREQLTELVEAVRSSIRRAFSSEDYEQQRRQIFESGQREAQGLIEGAQRGAEEQGFYLRFSPTGVTLLPMTNGKPMTPDQYADLEPERRKEIEARQQEVMESVGKIGERLRVIEREVNQRMRQLDRHVGESVLTGLFASVILQNESFSEVVAFLGKLQEFTLENMELFRDQEEAQTQAGALPLPSPTRLLAFQCNVFVDNSQVSGPPIISEPNPTWSNLFGKIERRAQLGTYISDHMMLKPGAVHIANGGYLVLNLTDMVTKAGAWEGLKRLIRTKQVQLEDPMEQYGLLSPQGLRPEPIPVDLKVIVTGEPLFYHLLSTQDEEFWEMFKVKADFDTQINRTPENALSYAGFICASSQRDKLRHFDRTGVASVIEYGSRMVEDQEKLSARFGRLRDLLVEADYWAGQAGARLVTSQHVERAIGEKVYRLNLIEDRLRELIARGVIIVDVSGVVVGQVNGLSIMDFGEFSFGRPSRITARTFMGQRGVISIDRESQMTGRIHDKGMLILSGYLGWKFAQDKPLSVSASIVFEQAYEPVEGDSASLAELCAVCSSLAEAPIRQDLAITGSVNQMGSVQPIGGVNQKIEGFHDVCRAVGFTGQQGVIIPSRNRHNLMLREDVVESAREGRFHVYAVDTVDEALELLTGATAGARGEDGSYPEESINGRVEKRLREMGETIRRFGRDGTDLKLEREEDAAGKAEEAAAEDTAGEA